MSKPHEFQLRDFCTCSTCDYNERGHCTRNGRPIHWRGDGMRLAVIRARVGDKTTNLELRFIPTDSDGGMPACVYACMWGDDSRELFIEMTISDAYLLAMMLNEALGLEVRE